MLKNVSLFAFLALSLCLVSCKSSFEKVRTSGDSKLIFTEAMKYYEDGDYLKAQSLMELVLGAYRGKPELEELYFKYAKSYYLNGEYLMAAYYFENFSSTYPSSSFKEDSDFFIANSYFRTSLDYKLDQTNTEKAINALQDFIDIYPQSEHVEDCSKLIDICRDRLEAKDYQAAKLYYDLKQYQSAMRSLENLLIDFPDSDRSEEIRYKIVEASYLLADNSIYEKKYDRFSETIEKANVFLRRYPTAEFTDAVEDIKKDSEKQIKSLSNE